jgi:hypothetical protein
LVHVDAHADLGLGDASWVHIVSELLRLPVAQRSDPPRGSRFLNAGSYIAYALAARRNPRRMPLSRHCAVAFRPRYWSDLRTLRRR